MPEPTYTAVDVPFDPPGLTVGVDIDAAGVTYFANRQTKQIQRFPVDGPLETLPVTGLGDPYGLTVDAAGRVLVADAGLDQVVRFDPATNTQEVLPFTGLDGPTDVAIDSQGRILVVNKSRWVVRLDDNGQQETLGTTEIIGLHGIAVGADDTIYVTKSGGGVPGLYKFGPDDEPVRIALYNLDGPAGVTVGQDGVVYVANGGQAQYASRIARFQPDGTFLSHIRTWIPLSGLPAVLRPLGIALDAADNITVFGYQPEAIRLIRN